MLNAQATQYEKFGFDSQVITVDRDRDILSWNTIGKGPEGEIHGATCGMHWPNVLHPDPNRNFEIIDKWIKFLKPYNHRLDTMLAPNSLEFRHQLVQHACTKPKVNGNTIRLDFTNVDKIPGKLGKNKLTLKIKSLHKVSFKANAIKIIDKSVAEHEDAHLYTLQLERMPRNKEARIDVVHTAH